MARVRRSYEVAIDYDRRILHPGCTGGFSVGLHDQFGVRRAVIEPGHAATGNYLERAANSDPRQTQTMTPPRALTSCTNVVTRESFGKQGRAFCTTGIRTPA